MTFAQKLCEPDAEACAEKVPVNNKGGKLRISLEQRKCGQAFGLQASGSHE